MNVRAGDRSDWSAFGRVTASILSCLRPLEVTVDRKKQRWFQLGSASTIACLNKSVKEGSWPMTGSNVWIFRMFYCGYWLIKGQETCPTQAGHSLSSYLLFLHTLYTLCWADQYRFWIQNWNKVLTHPQKIFAKKIMICNGITTTSEITLHH